MRVRDSLDIEHRADFEGVGRPGLSAACEDGQISTLGSDLVEFMPSREHLMSKKWTGSIWPAIVPAIDLDT